MLTIQKAIDVGVMHALNHGVPAEIEPLDILNQAGTHLCSMRAWRWRERVEAPLVISQGAETVDLPEDVLEVIDVVSAAAVAAGSKLVSQSQMQVLKQANVLGGAFYWFAPSFEYDDSIDTGGPLVQKLRVWPPPPALSNGEFTLLYRATWRELKPDQPYESTLVTLPAAGYCDALYLAIVRAFAKGYDKDDEGDVDARLALIGAGALYNTALEADNRVAQSLGGVRNTAIDMVSETSGPTPIWYPNVLPIVPLTG